MKEKILLVILFTTFGLWVRGQSLSPSVIAAAGAQNFTTTLSLEWTLGELAVSYLDLERGLLTEGFHQPLLEIAEIPNNLFSNEYSVMNQSKAYTNSSESAIEIDVWPNPVRSILTVRIESETSEAISIELMDLLGRNMISKTNHAPFGLIEFDLTHNTPGLYLLKFFKKDGTLIKTVLNTKH